MMQFEFKKKVKQENCIPIYWFSNGMWIDEIGLKRDRVMVIKKKQKH